jgi:hypothetical protein
MMKALGITPPRSGQRLMAVMKTCTDVVSV